MKISCSVWGTSLLILLFFCGGASAIAATTCSYDPASGKPNPLGMRSFITLTENEGNTTVVYEQFPSIVAENITISTIRELVFHNTNIRQARTLLLQTKKYYSELVGYDAPEGFKPINSVLVCRYN